MNTIAQVFRFFFRVRLPVLSFVCFVFVYFRVPAWRLQFFFLDLLDAASDEDSEETAFIRLPANRTGHCRYYFLDIDVFVFVFFNLYSNQTRTLSVFREMVVRLGRCG